MKNSCVAVIQAGGRGTRLHEITKDLIPKPMAELNGKPLLQWQIESLLKYGIKDIIIIIGYLGEKIENYFKNGQEYGVKIKYIKENKPLGSAGALSHLKKYKNQNFLLIFGDVMFDMDLDRFFDFYVKKRADVAFAVHPNSHPYDSDIIKLDSENKVEKIYKKNEKRTEFYNNIVNSGISLFNSDILSILKDGERADWENDVIVPIIKKGKVYGYKTSEYIKDVGTVDRFKKAEKEQITGKWKKRNLSIKQKCVFLDRDGTINIYKGLIINNEDCELYEGTIKALKKLNDSDFLSIIVTNQPVVARGMCSIENLKRIHAKIETELGNNGAYIDDIIFCPHHPDRGYEGENKEYKIECDCRKPQIGMIRKMVDLYNIDLKKSFIVGDTTVDVMTGKNAGLKTIMVKTGEGGKDKKYNVKADKEVRDLLEAVEYILSI